MSIISTSEIPLNDVKPFILANVNLQKNHNATARMCIVGSPGCGKSDLIREVCEENGWGLNCKYLSNMSQEQITGIPCKVESGDIAKWTKPEIFNFDNLEYKPENYEVGKSVTILLIDDFHLADKMIQKYLFQLLTYKELNGYKLPENTAIILAGNRLIDKALAHSIPAPVMNRISVYEVKPEPSDWVKNFAIPYGIRPDILSFISSRGDTFLCQEPVESVSWASPRSWTFLSDQMNEYEKLFGRIPLNKLNLIANGLIGSEFTSEFISYREIYSKWNIDELLMKSKSDLKSLIEKEVSKNSINAFALSNSAIQWMISNAKTRKYNLDDQNLIKIINFAYEIMTILLACKCQDIQIKPLITAGTNYMYLYSESLKSSDEITKFKNIRLAFLKNLYQKRDVDWIYYEIMANIFDIELSSDDIKNIENAKKNFKG